MPLASGTTLGPYEILSPLGAGGMGEVYRATDTKLNRAVAIKAMNATGALDPDQVARFEREAQLLASLNHPNIAAIHGLETVGAATYLVLEFVDGRPLSEVVREGPLPVDEALAIARQIADALAATHERGIIHRDLKPGNIMVTADGHVKVLDFGLGKNLDAQSAADATPAGQANSPTMTMAATQAGIVLGTAGYMSPEQAKGRTADRRSDVWAFGCVLFEMLAGRRAFDGEDITETLAAIVRGEPDWGALPAGTPPAIRRLIERCLTKSRADRLPDMSVVRFVLNEPAGGVVAPASTRGVGRAPSVLVVAATAVVALLAGAGGVYLWSVPGTSGDTEPRVLSMVLPEGDTLADARQRPLALSRDGRFVAYSGVRAGTDLLYVRALHEAAPQALPGTEGATGPFFSHNGEWIGFFAQGQLKKISVDGAGLQTITTDAPAPRGGAWTADDTIYFSPNQFSGLVSVPAAGGTPISLTTLDAAAGEVSHRWPYVLPDGKTLLFTAWTGPGHDEHWAAVATLGPSGPLMHTRLLSGADTAQYAEGHLVYGKEDTLFAVPWQPGHTDLGRAVPVTQSVNPRFQSESTLFALSEQGTLIFLQGDPERRLSRAVWVDRSGRATPLPTMALDNYTNLTISPDGTRAVVQVMKGVEALWIYDFARHTLTPLTSMKASSQAPVWQDNQFVIYRGTRAGTRNLYRKRADGSGDEERLTTKAGVVQTPTSVSRDGQWLVFSEGGADSASDVFRLALKGEGVPQPLVQTPARDVNGQLSPDGRWLAYEGHASGRAEVYVQPFPTGPASQVSVGGGVEPRWSRDSRELYYVPRSADRLMVMTVSPGPTWAPGPPRVLFEGVYKPNLNGNTPFDVSADGRFLRIQSMRPDAQLSRIEVVLNWKPTGK